MLDTENPKSASIVAAARQIDIILQLSKHMTLNRTIARRRYTLEIIRPAFAALRWLNAERFDNSSYIATAIDALENSAAAIADMPVLDAEPTGKHDKICPVCRGSVSTIRGDQPYCTHCLEIITPALTQLESWDGFGTDAI